jgi:hypothetical protein
VAAHSEMKSSVMLRRTGATIAAMVVLSVPYGHGAAKATIMSMTGKPTPMLMATTPDSFTPKVDALPASGWTATASDQSSSYPASYAIDGNTATIWHSSYSPTSVRLPHSITLNWGYSADRTSAGQRCARDAPLGDGPGSAGCRRLWAGQA